MLKSGRSGRNFNCQICHSDPERKKVWGCEERTLMATPTMIDETIEGNEKVITQYWSCPVKFIPDSIWSFIKYKTFHEKHPSAFFPDLDTISPRYLAAENIFENELGQCLSEGA